MKRPKAFMPRSGIKFERGQQRSIPAGFVGGDVAVMTTSGSQEKFVADSDDGADRLSKSIGPFGTADKTDGLNEILVRGDASWTNSHIRNSAFVIMPLSSSDHEAQVLNAYRAGTEVVGDSRVAVYASKRSPYRHVTVKKTASFDDLKPLPSGVDGGVPVFHDPAKGTNVTSVSGSFMIYYPPLGTWVSSELLGSPDLLPSSRQIPALIPIEVPFSGKIVDLKVWIELVQVSGSGGTGITNKLAGRYPLGNLMISLRSPHVRGFHAHPIRNSPALKQIFTSNFQDFTFGNLSAEALQKGDFGPDYINPLYRDSFLLWEGAGPIGRLSSGPWDDDYYKTPREVFNTLYPSWERDRSMRTVFCDGSPVPNPRHLIPGGPSASFQGAPNSYFGFDNAWGFDVPWTSETEISGANTYQASGSPPKGWLNGQGGVNLPDEWPTTGVNYGAETIRPVYPLLDPLFQRKRLSFQTTKVVSTSSAIFNTDDWVGFRPGLRGTEVSGTWYLMIADHRADPIFTAFTGSSTPTFFRQVRLEFVLTSGSMPATRNDYSDVDPRDPRREIVLSTISGSSMIFSDDVQIASVGTSSIDAIFHPTASWEAHLNDTYVARNETRADVGRTFGITFLTGTAEFDDSYALYYRLSGTLSDISGSNPSWLLDNQFGVPAIPISSASLVEPGNDPMVSVHPQKIVQRPLLDGARRLSDAARDAQPAKTRLKTAADLITGSLT